MQQIGNVDKWMTHSSTPMTVSLLKLLHVRILDEHVSCHLFGTSELTHESLRKFTLPYYFFFFVNLVSSSLCMSIHIKLYQRPTYTSLSNKYQARSRYNWLAQILPASRGQLYNREQPASWIIMKWHHRLAWVLSFRYSVSCLCLLWSMWIAVLLGICRNKKFSLCLPSGPD